MAPATRIVAVGASNLTLGLQSLVATARAHFGADVEVVAALGYGRSYGAPSTVGFRTLPGILGSNLWRALKTLPSANTKALITDVGNDVLYSVPPARILEWVDEIVTRLHRHTNDVSLTNLPLASIKRLSPRAFLFFRTLFFPPCRLSREDVFERVGEVNEGLVRLAKKRGVRLVHLDPSWYGLDPIHIRPSAWRSAWRTILFGANETLGSGPHLSAAEWLALHSRAPEQQWLFGQERIRPQIGRRVRWGGKLWLF